MSKKPLVHSARLHPSQKNRVDAVRKFRNEARALQAVVSKGSYGSDEVELFWRLAREASSTLHIANPEIAERAGLGLNFFTTVVRDQRRPKLGNFLRALDIMIEVADERLFDTEHPAGDVSSESAQGNAGRIEQDHEDILLLSLTLSELAREEISRLVSERPNSDETARRNEKQIELLTIFANGFDRIAAALRAVGDNPKEPFLSEQAAGVVNAVGRQLNEWWAANGSEAVDWAIRLPTFVGSVAALSWAGADMTIATTAVAAFVGGEKMLKTIQGKKKG